MHLAIISTTINGEKGYIPYDALAQKSKFSKVNFFITGDKTSKPFDVSPFSSEVVYLDVEAQGRFHCSEAIGWKKIMRRNISLLAAMEQDPDFILTIDDDNIPADDYFDKWYSVITEACERIALPKESADEPCWHNYLETSNAEIELYPRGFPVPFRDKKNTQVTACDSISADKIGLFQGISLGDPDIDAMTRIVYSKRLPLQTIEQKNYCLKDVWSPYNTQNTLYAKSIFPLIATWPHCGRFDDIYASYAQQQFLFSNNMYAHVGEAINKQDRGIRNPLIDLNNEVEGYFHSHEVWRSLLEINESDPLKFILRLTESDNEIITRHNEFFFSYLKDLEAVMSK